MLIKIDILSNNGLSQCIEIEPKLKIDSFTFDDPEVFKYLQMEIIWELRTPNLVV